MHWLWYHAGLSSGNSPWYLFPSGWGSILLAVGFLTTPIVLWRKHKCEVHKCWRLGRHGVEGTRFTVCRRHLPSGHGRITHEHITDAWNKHRKAM
jgi:hypothetical protein